MNYELAKELKEAGFPQGDELYCRCSFLTRAEKEADGVEEIYDCRTERVYNPTLSELIEECGAQYLEGSETFDFTLNYCLGAWYASYTDKQDRPTPILGNGVGPNPKEAVSRLWLVLKKNKALPPKQE